MTLVAAPRQAALLNIKSELPYTSFSITKRCIRRMRRQKKIPHSFFFLFLYKSKNSWRKLAEQKLCKLVFVCVFSSFKKVKLKCENLVKNERKMLFSMFIQFSSNIFCCLFGNHWKTETTTTSNLKCDTFFRDRKIYSFFLVIHFLFF